jgi:hypothetical protein
LRPLAWAAIGGVVTGSILLLTRKAQAQVSSSKSEPEPEKTYGETTLVALAVPAGWRRVMNAEVSALPELSVQANSIRSEPGFTLMAYGTLRPFVASDGRTYATWVEQHYHEPGGAARPWGLHHGVTILTRS